MTFNAMTLKIMRCCLCNLLLAVSSPAEASVTCTQLINYKSNVADSTETKYYRVDYDVMAGKMLSLNGVSAVMSEATLTKAEIDVMKKVLYRSVSRFNRNTRNYPEMKIELQKYGVQYFAYLDEKRRKVIWINGFCEDMSVLSNSKITNYRREIVTAFDGGSCYFNATIPLKGNRRVPIYIHGSA